VFAPVGCSKCGVYILSSQGKKTFKITHTQKPELYNNLSLQSAKKKAGLFHTIFKSQLIS
jgi:hypothetical protein